MVVNDMPRNTAEKYTTTRLVTKRYAAKRMRRNGPIPTARYNSIPVVNALYSPYNRAAAKPMAHRAVMTIVSMAKPPYAQGFLLGMIVN